METSQNYYVDVVILRMFFTRAGRASVTSVLNSGEEGDPTAVPLRHLNAKTFQMPFCLSLTDCEKVVVYAGDDIYAKNITALNHILIKVYTT